MWHKTPTQINKVHKGWKYSIIKANKYGYTLQVVITPGIHLNAKYLSTLPNGIGIKIYEAYEEKITTMKHKFVIDPLYPLIAPWGEAESKARIFIDNHLGEFNVEETLKSLDIGKF